MLPELEYSSLKTATFNFVLAGGGVKRIVGLNDTRHRLIITHRCFNIAAEAAPHFFAVTKGSLHLFNACRMEKVTPRARLKLSGSHLRIAKLTRGRGQKGLDQRFSGVARRVQAFRRLKPVQKLRVLNSNKIVGGPDKLLECCGGCLSFSKDFFKFSFLNYFRHFESGTDLNRGEGDEKLRKHGGKRGGKGRH